MRAWGLAVYLFPYIFGPIGGFGALDRSGDLTELWGVAGGYLGATALFLAILSLFQQKTYRCLRWMLALWIALFLARTFGFPGSATLFHFIPGMDLTQVHRYSAPSWELAAVILAAFALDDWWAGRKVKPASLIATAILTVISARLVLWLGWGVVGDLLHALPGYRHWLKYSLELPGAVLLAAVYVPTHAGAEPFSSYRGTARPRLVYRDPVLKIFELLNPAPYFETSGAPCSLRVESREVLRASCRGPAHLTRRELFYPGWRAAINNKRVSPVLTASIFQGIDLPAPGHSSRSSVEGSSDSARCAGIHVASSPSNAIATTTPVNTRGSRGVA
jgi:hypothetical protein